ncbi:MAG: arylsulfatase [Planctomycetaceae bacterium]
MMMQILPRVVRQKTGTPRTPDVLDDLRTVHKGDFMTILRTLFIASFVLTGWLPSAVAAQLPNIVIILVDDMGYGDPQCYNSESKIPTPHIDRLASAGMSFRDAHASGPLCHVSRYGLMTGCYPFRAPVGKWATQPTIRDDQLTVPQMLKQAGYQTQMVGKWHLGFAENGYDQPLPGGPVDRGFDSFFGIRASTDIPPYFYIRGNRAVTPPTDHIEARNTDGWSPIQGEFWRAGGIAPDLQLKDVLPKFGDESVQVIQEHAEQQKSASEADRTPLMLYVAYPAPHTPWLPDEKFRNHSGASMYGDFAMMVDDQVGRLLNALDTAGMSGNTLVIFSSDNGPTWYEADVERFGHDCSGGLRGMKADAWEAGHRVPFIVRWPGVTKAGSVSQQLVSFVDVMATLADVTKVSLPDDAAPDSFSFHDVLTGQRPESNPVRTELALQSGSGFMTLRDRHWKLIQGLGSGGFSEPKRIRPQPGQPSGQLYDLQSDLAEEHDQYAAQPDRVRLMSDRLRTIQESSGHRHLKTVTWSVTASAMDV